MITLDRIIKNAALAYVCSVALTGCFDGDDGTDGTPGASGPSGADGRTALIAMVPEPPGSNCSSGGSRIDSGVDQNSNRVLDPVEVVGTQYVCNGAGTSVAQSLVRISDEPVGVNCPNGGERFSAGQDSDANGVLDDSEVTSTGYACNGSNGGAGSRILMALISEPAGANCSVGGIRVTSGPDANGNNALDGAETVSTQYVCNGANGTAGSPGQSALIATGTEAPGINCAYGGTWIAAGPDANANGTLEGIEITATNYACDGAPGPGPGSTWVEVTSPVQAAANTGYLAMNDHAQVVVTLPDNPPLGSVVQVTGLGRGGWKIAQNADQYVIANHLSGGYIRAREYATITGPGLSAVACSYDCSVIVSTDNSGPLRKSLDGGQSWTVQDADRQWRGVAASVHGDYLYAVADSDRIYRGSRESTGYWEAREDTRAWRGIACSADGTKVVAVAIGARIYTSTDRGQTFTPQDQIRNWVAVASSADGTRLIAAVDGGQLYTSTNSGVTWTARETDRVWRAVASSADGQKLAAVAIGPSFTDGALLTSADGGATWTLRDSPRAWHGVASSADGTRLTAVAHSDSMYTSIDSGETWTEDLVTDWYMGVASSADGLTVATVSAPGVLMLSETVTAEQTAIGVSGYIVGGQHDAIALQYAGGGKFIPLSHTGTFVVR